MIYIYGDSHGMFSFKNLNIPYIDYHENSITMHRIGRDNKIIHFNNTQHDSNSIICLVYGEVDCRCHIQRQIDIGRNEDDVIYELVVNYFNTIKSNINIYKKIIIVGIIPPTKKSDCENINGPMLGEVAFVGTDEDRSKYTIKVNKLIEELCNKNGYIYFNPYYYYTRPEDGTLKYELSDKTVHLGDNTFFLEKFIELYRTIIEN
jgi:hypothetical protein